MSERLALGAARPEDASRMLAIERASYSHPWSEASLREAVTRPQRFLTLVLRAEGEPGEVAAYCVAQLVADELHVHNVAVDPGRRRRGLARRLLGHALEHARAAGARRALLEVREGNRAGRALYESLGFVEVGHRRGYYRDPPEDALLFAKDLS